jgi:hypothetical protein
MADPLMHNPSLIAAPAPAWPARRETMPQERPPEATALLRLYPAKTDNADPDQVGAHALSVHNDLRRQLTATAEQHALSREIGLLRELLSDRDKRVTDKDRVIDQLRRQLAAADAERRAMQRWLIALSTDRRAGAVRALGRVFEGVLAALIEPASPAQRATERLATAQDDRARAEKALLEQIARHHRQWTRWGDGAV